MVRACWVHGDKIVHDVCVCMCIFVYALNSACVFMNVYEELPACVCLFMKDVACMYAYGYMFVFIYMCIVLMCYVYLYYFHVYLCVFS